MFHEKEKRNLLPVTRKFLAVAFALLLLGACSSIDCTLHNTITTYYKILQPGGDSLQITDTLNITSTRSDGKSMLLLNRCVGKASFRLPVSYSHPEDILVFKFNKDTVQTLDTVWVKKEDIMHFESVDCGAIYFHELISVRHTYHGIDSLVIVNPSVNYDPQTVHFNLYPKIRK
ncbi:MAG: hypothetical protein K5764_09010 [Prevotella sp.]|nr:hypothetical protein [Prevotella sp.]